MSGSFPNAESHIQRHHDLAAVQPGQVGEPPQHQPVQDAPGMLPEVDGAQAGEVSMPHSRSCKHPPWHATVVAVTRCSHSRYICPTLTSCFGAATKEASESFGFECQRRERDRRWQQNRMSI
eukprot:scaffold540971_cov21-Prasinocladus_malaysianus.AAC.1